MSGVSQIKSQRPKDHTSLYRIDIIPQTPCTGTKAN